MQIPQYIRPRATWINQLGPQLEHYFNWRSRSEDSISLGKLNDPLTTAADGALTLVATLPSVDPLLLPSSVQ